MYLKLASTTMPQLPKALREKTLKWWKWKIRRGNSPKNLKSRNLTPISSKVTTILSRWSYLKRLMRMKKLRNE